MQWRDIIFIVSELVVVISHNIMLPAGTPAGIDVTAMHTELLRDR